MNEALARWAHTDPLSVSPEPASAPVAPMPPPPAAPPGFGYVWQPPYGYVMVSLNPVPHAPMPGAAPAPFVPAAHGNPYAPRPGEPSGPGPSPVNGGGIYVQPFVPQGSMLVKQGDRDPWDERMSTLPELSVPGAPPPGAFDAMEGRFNPAIQRDLAQIQAEIRSSFPAAGPGFAPLEGSGVDAAGHVRHSRGSVGPLAKGG